MHYDTVRNSLRCAYGFRQRKQSEHECSSETRPHMSQVHSCLPKCRGQHKPETHHLHPNVGPAQTVLPRFCFKYLAGSAIFMLIL